MKTIRVVAAVICDSMQEKRKIYATARGYGDYKGQWEFPGGKVGREKSLPLFFWMVLVIIRFLILFV